MWSTVSNSPEPRSSSSNSSTRPSSVDSDVSNHLHGGDVAIVGMACRTAGGINSPEKLWQFLLDKKDGSGEVPRMRWEPWLRRDARNAKEVEKTLSRGYFIEDLENFDASFFGISPKEAEQMDPHQRLGLELSWEALENAGLNPKSLAGSDTAVFMGIDSDDYSRLLLEDMPNIEAWMGIGTAAHGVPNRISYHLDLMGPSSAVDAACASSLVAVHLGRQAILNRESQVAIVGGVNVLLAPALTRMLGKAGALSHEGICRSFDDAANGYARGEGGAIIILKNLASAIADGDNILATLKGSAIAQDGKTNGIMAPNSKAQELVGRQALARACIDPRTVGYVEAHATATPLGDPTELSAISAIYGPSSGRPRESPCLIGSIKPNVGHLEAAAGAIGLIKAVLAVNKGQLAPQTHLNKLNSRVDWDSSGLKVVRETRAWSTQDGPRRAAVCSYGYGGTVSHAIVEQSPVTASVRNHLPRLPADSLMLTLSSSQEKRLPLQAAALASWLSSEKGQVSDLRVIATTLAQRRAQHDCRVVFAVTDHQQAIQTLVNFSKGALDSDRIITGRVLGNTQTLAQQPVWVFSGHGAQWKDMGKELLHRPAFLEAIRGLDKIVVDEAGFSAIAALQSGEFEASERVQILTYIVQVGLTKLLISQGMTPRAIIGHSVGEIAASVAAGCLTPEEGALIVTRRAKLYAQVRNQTLGGMALVNLPFSTAREELGSRKDIVAAIDSSPSTCVVSGEAQAIDAYIETLKGRGIQTFRVKTDVAFHSPMLEQLDGPLREVLSETLDPRPAVIPIYSSSHRDQRTTNLRDTDYWVNNMISPVHLRSAVNAAVDDGYRLFVEISSHPIVLHSINETLVERGLDEDDFATIATMKRNVSPMQSIQEAAARLLVKGSDFNLEAYFGHKRWWCPDVPGTPWVHKPYYKQVETGPRAEGLTHDVEKHTLLGQRKVVSGTDTVVYSTTLDDRTKPFPLTHPLDGTEIIPAAVYINTFHHATGATRLSDMQLRVPVAMSSETRQVQIVVQGGTISVGSSSGEARREKPEGSGPELERESDETWVAHSSCKWSMLHPDDDRRIMAGESFNADAIKERIGTRLPNSFSVDYLKKIGVAGIAFPWEVVEHYGNSSEMIAKVDMDPTVESLSWDKHSWAPLLDAATSVGSTMFFDDPKLRIVSQIDDVFLYPSDAPPPKIGYLHVEAAPDAKSLASHVNVLSEQGQLLARFQSMRFSEVEGASGISGSVESLVHRIAWVPPKFTEKSRPLDEVILVSTNRKLAESYTSQLRPISNNCHHAISVTDLESRPEMLHAAAQKGSTVIYIPDVVESTDHVQVATEEFIWEATSLVKLLTKRNITTTKLFVLTNRVYLGDSPTSLAHGALYGLGRIIAAEHPDLWGGLIDLESTTTFPSIAVKYVQGYDVLRIVDGLPMRAVMRPLTREHRREADTTCSLLPKPEGTYVITGGLGDLGMETSQFLVEQGARRIVLLSRRGLPPRREWRDLIKTDGKLSIVIKRIMSFEKLGATIHPLALDISSEGAAETLQHSLDSLGLPPVLGVVHAAGILEDSLLTETTRDSFSRVLAPKVSGAIALHKAFPPGSVDFFVLYSSIGQLIGTAGQASYASGNAFLDSMAVHRRAQGDNAIAFQWSAWRALGMATSTDFITAELQSKGATDISRDEAFRAWEHVSKYDVESVVVTRCLAVDEGEPVSMPLFEDVVVRRPRAQASVAGKGEDENSSALDTRPTDPKALAEWLDVKIRKCIASVLLMPDIDEIDRRTPISDLGVDSVMTVTLRQKLQASLKVKVPPTLTWNHPTVSHLVPWFATKLNEA